MNNLKHNDASAQITAINLVDQMSFERQVSEDMHNAARFGALTREDIEHQLAMAYQRGYHSSTQAAAELLDDILTQKTIRPAGLWARLKSRGRASQTWLKRKLIGKIS
jgi:hypothetical protein